MRSERAAAARHSQSAARPPGENNRARGGLRAGRDRSGAGRRGPRQPAGGASSRFVREPRRQRPGEGPRSPPPSDAFLPEQDCHC